MKLFSIAVCSALIATTAQADSFSPAPFKLTDGFFVIPLYHSEAYYDDNIYTSETNLVSSMVYIIQPSLKFGVDDGINRYGGSYKLTSGIYSEDKNGSDNYVDHQLALTAHSEFTNKHRLDMHLGFSNTHEDRGSALTDGSEDAYSEPLKYDNYNGKIYYEYGAKTARVNIGGGFQYNQSVYQNFTDTTRYDDTASNKLMFDSAYKVGSVTYLTAGLSFKDTTYLHKEDAVASQDNSDSRLSLGLRWKGLGKTVGRAKFGYQYKTFSDNSREDFNGSTIDIGVDWSPLKRSRIQFSISRAAEDSSTYGDYILVLGSTLSWQNDWSDGLRSTLKASYSDDDYIGSDNNREYKTASAGFSVSYDFSRWFTLSTGYTYTDRDSNISGYGYQQNVVNLGVTFSL